MMPSKIVVPEIVVAEEIAIEDFRMFAYEKLDSIYEPEFITEKLQHALQALTYGWLTLDGDKPTYRLKTPIRNTDGDVAVSEITFRYRISHEQQRKIAKPMGMKLEPILMAHHMKAFSIGQPLAMLDKFGPFDSKVIEEFTNLFL